METTGPKQLLCMSEEKIHYIIVFDWYGEADAGDCPLSHSYLCSGR